MSGNQKQQAPTVMPQPHPRYSPQGPDQFHVAPQPYVQQQQPPNQTGNQGPGPNLRGMAPTVPPAQASTPPIQDMNKVQHMQQQPQVNIGYVRQPPTNYYRAPQQNQSSRMPQTHRQPNNVFQGAQQIYTQPTAQPPFMQIPMQSMIINPSALYPSQINPNGNQQTRYIAPNNIPYFSQPYVHYAAAPQQTQIFYAPYQQLQRTAHPAQVTAPQHVAPLGQQPQPQQLPTATYAPSAVQMQPAVPPPRKTKQRSHAIAIIDPSTGKRIEDSNLDQNELSSLPASGESSARQTPQPSTVQRDIKQEVRAEFAKQVAQTMHDDGVRIDEQSPQHQPPQQQQPPPPQQQQQQMHHSAHHHQQQQQQQQQQQPLVSYHIDPQAAIGHAQTYQLQGQQVSPIVPVQTAQLSQQQYMHHPTHAHGGLQTQQMYATQYTAVSEFVPRQQQQQLQQQEIQMSRPQQVMGSSHKFQVGGEQEPYEPINETPVVSAQQGEEVTVITASSLKHNQRTLNEAKTVKKYRENEPTQGIILLHPPIEEVQQPHIGDLTRDDNSCVDTSATANVSVTTEQRVAKITVCTRSAKESPTITSNVVVGSKQTSAPLREQSINVEQHTATVSQQQYRDTTSSDTATSVSSSSSNVSSSTAINNNKVSNKKDDKSVTEVPALSTTVATEELTLPSEFSVQAQDNAKSKQGSQRINKEVSKPIPQQQPHHIPSKQQLQTNAVAKVSIPVPQTQPSKPNNKTQKHKDLNIKGATKEGTDMDVFSDITTLPNAIEDESSAITSNSKPNVENQVEQVPAVTSERVILNVNSNTNTAVPISSTNVVPESIPKKPESQTIKSIPKSSYDVCAIVKEMPKPFVAPAPVPAQLESKDQTDRCEMTPDNSMPLKNDFNVNNVANKIIYDEDQWAPNNTGGKKQYGRDFLLAISLRPQSKAVPQINLICDILKDGENKTHIGDNLNRMYGSSRSGSDYINWTSGKNSSQKGPRHGSQHKQPGGGGGGGGGKGSKIGGPMVSISVKGDVKLHECENAWKPIMRNKVADVDTSEEDAKTEDLYRKVRGILNKLTPQKFETLILQFKNLVIDTEVRLSGVIDLVFEKAVDESNFSVAYASLCSHLSTLQVPFGPDSKISNDKEEKYVNFRKMLLMRCQSEFESNSSNEKSRNNKLFDIEECAADPEKKKELLAQLEEESRRIRMKSVGNIRFIGELFKANMLTHKIMYNCLVHLIEHKHEDSLECLCKLLTTVGKELEKKEKTQMTSTFNTMKEIANKKLMPNVSSRVRFMLQDVIDLRANSWVPRRQDSNPKTMDQIQKEADTEQMDIQVLNAMPPPMRNPGPPQDRNTRRAGGGGGASRSITEDGWSPVMNRNNRPPTFSVQPDKLKIKPQEVNERLGSMQQFNTWGRGSGGSDIKSSNVTNPLMGNRNMFAALQPVEPTSENFNRNNRDPYSSKGHSLEKYAKQYDGPSSRSGSQHRTQHHSDMSDRDSRPHGGQSMSLHMPSSTSEPSFRSQPPITQQALQSQQQKQQQQQQQQKQQQQQQQQQQQHQAPSVPVSTAVGPVPAQQPSVCKVKYPTDEAAIVTLEKKLNYTIDEYNNDVHSMDDVAKALTESLPNDYYNRFVSLGLMRVLDKSPMHRQKMGNLLGQLIVSNNLTLDQYCIGLEEVLSASPDLEIDIPKIWDSLADLIVPAIFLEVLPFNRLQSISKELISNQIAHKMLTAIFIQIIRIKGPDFLQSAWRSSHVSLSNFIPVTEVDDFIKANNLQILVGGNQLPKINNLLNFEELRRAFIDFFNKHAPFDEICNWIKANIGDRIGEKSFIRPFFTAILERSIVTEDNARKTKKFRGEVFDNYTNLIQRFISCDLEAQLQCLYATQTLINKLEHPQGLLLSIFDKLDESSSITPEAFYKWEKCDDPAENLNKGVCLKQLSAFINNLKEGEESPEEA